MESTSLREIDVQVFSAFTGRVTKSWLRMVARQALQFEDPDESSSISLVIADDETLRGLNLNTAGWTRPRMCSLFRCWRPLTTATRAEDFPPILTRRHIWER